MFYAAHKSKDRDSPESQLSVDSTTPGNVSQPTLTLGDKCDCVTNDIKFIKLASIATPRLHSPYMNASFKLLVALACPGSAHNRTRCAIPGQL